MKKRGSLDVNVEKQHGLLEDILPFGCPVIQIGLLLLYSIISNHHGPQVVVGTVKHTRDVSCC